MDNCSLCNEPVFKFRTSPFVECRNQNCTAYRIRINAKDFNGGIMKRFVSFWNSYPKGKKVGKPQAISTWLKLKPDDTLTQKIITGVVAHTFCEQWKNVKYIPHPSTFLNARGWEDEIVTESKRESTVNAPSSKHTDENGYYKPKRLRNDTSEPEAKALTRKEAFERCRKILGKKKK